MAGITRHRAFRWGWALVLTFATSLWFVSLFRGICYAGDYGFFVLTDGYVVVPAGGPRTWGDWGWWMQDSWLTPGDWYDPGLLLPIVRSPGQIGSAGIHLPLTTIVGNGICVLLSRWLRPVRRELTAPEILIIAGCGAVLSRTAITMASALHPAAPWFAFIVLMPNCAAWTIAGVLRLCRGFRRYPIGFCNDCGYDLTGNVSGRCSECGTVIDESLKPLESI